METRGHKRPDFRAYTVEDYEAAGGSGKKSKWTEIGAAWAHKDGEGYDIRLKALPIDGRVQLRTLKDQAETKVSVDTTMPSL